MEGEDVARALEVKLLKPGQKEECGALSMEDLRHAFAPPAEGEGSEEEEEHEEPEETAAGMEALNVVPENPNHPHDGDMGELGEDGERENCPDLPDIPDVQEVEPNLDDLDWSIDEEIVYEPAPRHQHIPDEEPLVVSSSASGSKYAPGEEGLHATPASCRHMIPKRQEAKLQHKAWNRMDARKASGWQAWIASGEPSKWFPYSDDLPLKSKQAALDEAMAWLWSEDNRLEGK